MIVCRVKDAQAGENTSWSFLYHHYFPVLYAIALRILENPATAQDTVQETFIMAYLKLGDLKNPASFSRWLKKILIYKCFRVLKQYKRFDFPDEIPVDDNLINEEMEKGMELVTEETRLMTALMQLSESLRSTVLLRYFSQFQSYESIAKILAIPVGTVRSRLNEAKTQLLKHWNRLPAEHSEICRQNEEWNEFYFSSFAGIHRHDDCKNKFLSHLEKDVQVIYRGQALTGRKIFENKIADDRHHGSWLKPVHVISSGNISVVESRHFNSPEYPHHCPYSSVLVLHRCKYKVNKFFMHY